jgi:hypothetical protein
MDRIQFYIHNHVSKIRLHRLRIAEALRRVLRSQVCALHVVESLHGACCARETRTRAAAAAAQDLMYQSQLQRL